jgi:hypothetical protein
MIGRTASHYRAVELLREALDRHPGHAPTHFLLSYVYRYGGMLHPFMARDSFLDPLRAGRPFQGMLDHARTRHEAFKARFFPAAPAGAPPPSPGGPS